MKCWQTRVPKYSKRVLRTGTTQSENQDAAYLMYISNSRNDNARVPDHQIIYGDRSVLFQRPSWRCGATDPNSTPPPRSRGNIYHMCYRQSDHIAPECKFTLREKGHVVRNFKSFDEGQRAKVPKD